MKWDRSKFQNLVSQRRWDMAMKDVIMKPDQLRLLGNFFGCPGTFKRLDEGGRVQLQAGGQGLSACVSQKLKQPGAIEKIAALPKETGGALGKLKNVATGALKVAQKVISPFFLPAPNIAMQAAAGDVDPTSAETWLGPAFWSEAMTGLGVTKDTLGHKILRAGMKPSTVAKVSRFSGPALMATAAVDRGRAMANTFKKAEALGIPVENYVDRSSGVIEATDELYDEIRKRESGQGMDYFNGGIASLR